MQMKTQQRKDSITACDTIRYSNVVATICRHTLLTRQQYLQLFFETGCLLVEETFDCKITQQALLQNPKYGYWDWYMVQYLQHDEVFSYANMPYRNYSRYKYLWSISYKLDARLKTFYQYLKR
jgi:hypothetical protein